MGATENSNHAKFHRKSLTVEQAREAVWNHIRFADTVEVELLEAMGRRLAEAIRTEDPIPHFRRSGMDGYAVRSEDIAHVSIEPVVLEVIEQIPCGKEPTQKITSGKASRIMTGGMLPDGADTVIILESTDEVVMDGRTFVKIHNTDPRGSHVSSIGEEAECGAELLRRGETIGPGQMAVLAALGCSRVKVFRRPKVAILSTGMELLPVSEPLQMGKVRNSNAYMLAAQIASAGGEPLFSGQIPDDSVRARTMISELMSSDADMVITTGGVSVGDHDIMADFFMQWDGTTLFNKIAMRPGSPTSAGVWNKKLLFGLSGNPSASFVGFELFVRPVLLGMQCGTNETNRVLTGYLAEDYMKASGYTRYVRGVWQSHHGKIVVKPAGLDKSSAMLSIREANCLIVIPPANIGIREGEIVEVIPLGGIEW